MKRQAFADMLFNNPPADVAHPTCGVFVRLNRICRHGCSSARSPFRIQSAKARYTVNQGEA